MLENTSGESKHNTEYAEHTKKYTKLLEEFIKNTAFSNRLKSGLKIAFFIIIILIMIGLAILFACSIHKAFNIIGNLNVENDKAVESIIGAVTSIIPSLATMIVSLIKLPKIIAEYLFNPKEDEHMVAIIEKIQNYDIQMRSLENDIEQALMKKRKESSPDDKTPKKLQDIEKPSNAPNVEVYDPPS